MNDRFDYFVIFAEMRTGSNFLETNLNALGDVTCYGEAFNPHFIGYPNKTEILGVQQASRDENPAGLIWAIREKTEGLGGFRYFHDHDPRVLDMCLDDPRCAKIILTRNPLDSFVSLQIARETGQWKLTNVKRRKDSQITFDIARFEDYAAKLQAFQVLLLNRLQSSGQTAFYIAYEDLQDLKVINGLARFLRSGEMLEALDVSLKKQNPKPLSDKVSNYRDMEAQLTRIDTFGLSRTPNFEPRRGASVPGFVTGARAPLMFMPMRGGPEDSIRAWMAALDEVPADTLPTKMNQKSLRQWKRRNKGHRSFTVLRHPVARAHSVFCRRILQRGGGGFAEIRKTLRNVYKLPIPGGPPDADFTLEAHRVAFKAFLTFLEANLAGQTSIRVDAHWASQSEVLQGMGQFSTPDFVLREEQMDQGFALLADSIDAAVFPKRPVEVEDVPFTLAEVYDTEIEEMAARIYHRDYLHFGFQSWK